MLNDSKMNDASTKAEEISYLGFEQGGEAEEGLAWSRDLA